MLKQKTTSTSDPEISAMGIVNDALATLEPEARQRVLDYVGRRFGLQLGSGSQRSNQTPDQESVAPPDVGTPEPDQDDDSAGISPVALKWMRRNGLEAGALSTLFSLGVDEIDLVAKTVPGKQKKERMHSILLLKGIASYLSSGAARVMHEQLKEACLHYDAFDTANFATYLKSFNAEASGTKESGYTLTARGLTTATELIKSLIAPK